MELYKKEVEEFMVCFYNTLSEKDKRRYAAVEAKKLGHGGIKYISELLGCDEKTIMRGLTDLSSNPSHEFHIRKKGSGRKKALDTIKNIEGVFLEVLKNHTAGDPMKKDLFWTNLTQKEISEGMKEKGDIMKPSTKKTTRQWIQGEVRRFWFLGALALNSVLVSTAGFSQSNQPDWGCISAQWR